MAQLLSGYSTFASNSSSSIILADFYSDRLRQKGFLIINIMWAILTISLGLFYML
jgi:hypothetical protein